MVREWDQFHVFQLGSLTLHRLKEIISCDRRLGNRIGGRSPSGDRMLGTNGTGPHSVM